MSIVIGCITPHPPILVPEIGRDQLAQIEASKQAMKKLSRLVVDAKPETLVFISPHSPAFSDAFAVKTSSNLKGSFAQFGASSVKIEAKNDIKLAEEIVSRAKSRGVPAVGFDERMREQFNFPEELDHGVLVPFYYLWQDLRAFIVSCSISYLNYLKHYLFGIVIREAAEEIGRRIAVVASGDLSHRLTKQAPAGFNPRGKDFDYKLKDIINQGAFKKLFDLDQDLIDDAGECGLRSIFILAGIFNGYGVKSQVLSYEGPFGVGYLVAALRGGEEDKSRDFVKVLFEEKKEADKKLQAQESLPVKIARQAVEIYVREKKITSAPTDLPAYLKGRAGTFVSIKKNGALRGCIGTTSPTQPDIAHEIVRNAIHAASQDPRFAPVDESELPDLVYSVDILEQPEEIKSEKELDPKEYGVIVESGWRKGLLLPNLEGVETIQQQVDIAKRKAGIPPDEKVKLYRFKVKRYY